MPQARNATRPENVTVEELRSYLTEVEGKTATQRIMVGINHKEGIPQTKLADWYDVSRTTIHNWLNRLERLDEEPLEDVIYDEERPGRPSKLDDDERERLEEVLAESPRSVGYGASHWRPKLVRSYIADAFGVEYSLSHVRELLNELAPTWNERATTDGRNRSVEASRDVAHDRRSSDRTPDSGDNHSRDSDDDPAPHRVHGCRS